MCLSGLRSLGSVIQCAAVDTLVGVRDQEGAGMTSSGIVTPQVSAAALVSLYDRVLRLIGSQEFHSVWLGP